MEFEEERGLLEIGALQVAVDDFDAVFVQQFEAGHGKSARHDAISSFGSLYKAGKEDAQGVDKDWNRV